MSLIVKKEFEGYPPLVPNLYPARCYAIWELGTHECEFRGQKKDRKKLRIAWEVPSEIINIDGKDLPRNVAKIYTASFYQEADLLKHLNSWRGKSLSEGEAEGFDLKVLLGVECVLAIGISEQNDQKNIIESVYPPGYGNQPRCAPPVNPPVIYELEMGQGGTWGQISEFYQKMILKSREMMPTAKVGDAGAVPNETVVPAEDPADDNTSDDLPF